MAGLRTQSSWKIHIRKVIIIITKGLKGAHIVAGYGKFLEMNRMAFQVWDTYILGILHLITHIISFEPFTKTDRNEKERE